MVRWIACHYQMHNCSPLSEINDKGENIKITQIPGGLFQSSKPSGKRPHTASVSVYDFCGIASKRPHEIAWQAVFLAKLTYFLLNEVS